MLGLKLVIVYFMLASAWADKKDVDSTTTQKPHIKNRFFGLENIINQIFQGPSNSLSGAFGGHFHHSPEYHNQQNPQAQNNWQNIQTPNQAQSNLDQYLQSTTPNPSGNFNSQNIFGSNPNLFIQTPQQFPDQDQDDQQSSTVQNPSQTMTQGSFNPGNNLGQNQFGSGTLDDIPFQNGFNQGNQPGLWNQNTGSFQNPNLGNQVGNQNAGSFQNGNQMGSQSTPGGGDYNPVAIMGKPVAMTTSVPDSIVFQDGCDTPEQRQCVQDCQSSSEYKPVCGSNNVTYFNSGRFICARNCGVNVFIQRPGRCD